MSAEKTIEPGLFELMVAVPVWKGRRVSEVIYYRVPSDKVCIPEHEAGRIPVNETPDDNDVRFWHELTKMGVHMAHRPFDDPSSKVCGTFLVNLTGFRPREPPGNK